MELSNGPLISIDYEFFRMKLVGLVVKPTTEFKGFEQPVQQPCVVVYVKCPDCDALHIFRYSSRSWLNQRSASRFASRVSQRGSIDPTYWDYLGDMDDPTDFR